MGGAALNDAECIASRMPTNYETSSTNNTMILELYLLTIGESNSIDFGIFLSRFCDDFVGNDRRRVCDLRIVGALSNATCL